MNEIVRHTEAPMSSVALVPQDMDQAVRLAQAMSSAKLVPKHLQGDTGSCLMVVEQAMRWRMSPFAVAQCTSVISGKLNYEGKLVAAAVECSGAIEGGFDYQFAGTGDDRTITVSARRRGEASPRTMAVRLGDVKTTNEWWKRQPDQQLVYSGTRNWARRWTPSVMLGVYAPEEFNRDGSATTDAAFSGTTIDGAAEGPARTRETINESVPVGNDPTFAAEDSPADRWPGLFNEDDGNKWLANLQAALAAAQNDNEVTEIGNLVPVTRALASAPSKIKQDIIAAIAAATERVGQEAA